MVSIIIPTYNREMYINQCINSLLAQTYTDLEILIIDDGSTDNTVEICKKIAEGQSQIKVIPCTHKGVSSARNTGLKAAEGDFVFFIDSDDLIHPCLISQLMEIMKSSDIGASCCNLKNFRDEQFSTEGISDFDLSKGGFDVEALESEEFIEELFKKDGKSGAIGGKLFRKSCIEGLTFNEDISKGEDTYFLYNYALNGGNLAICNAEWYFYRRHSSNSAFVLKKQFEYDKYLKAFLLMYDSEKARGNQKNAQTLKWYIIDGTQQLYDYAREQDNKAEMKSLRRKMLNTLFSDKDGVATTKRKISFIIYAYCNPLHRIIKRILNTNEAPCAEVVKSNFQKGLVSVVTPTYNNEAYLAEMLDSVLNQTYDKIQMILVDDGSTDKTAEIAEGYKDKFAQRGYEYTVIHAEHCNASAAINAGLPQVKGEYIIWPDSDDLLENASVEKRVVFLNENPEYAAVRSLPEYFEAETNNTAAPRETITMSDNVNIFWDIIEGRSFVSCGCYMLKSAELFEIYPERKIPQYNVGQNFQMLLPYMYRHKCATIPQALYKVRVHSGSHSVRRLSVISHYRVIREFEMLIDEIAGICGINDKNDLRRIKAWKKKRRVGLRKHIFNSLITVRAVRKISKTLKR